MSDPQFTLIYDTYCGWCYGAAPIFDVLVQADIHITALHRRLFQGGAQLKMSNGFGQFAERADQRIAQQTGQPFSQTYVTQILRSKTEELNSELTARAAVLVHPQGAATEMALAHRLQKARYVDGLSASDPEPIIAALQPLLDGSMTEQQIRAALASESLSVEATAIAQRAEALMQRVGSSGVPTLVCTVNGQHQVISLEPFFQAPEQILSILN
ncbi:DsbA family protein [Motiliproteus sp.]|uniref:DsbA family protein n=1 Tax=Motiliproteus sp. TaxID=1898955 RepID=UPI003BAAC4BA